MMHQHDQNQRFIFMEATKLATEGTEYSHLISLLDPDQAMRVKVFVQELPLELARKTIYGRCATAGMQEKKKKR